MSVGSLLVDFSSIATDNILSVAEQYYFFFHSLICAVMIFWLVSLITVIKLFTEVLGI